MRIIDVRRLAPLALLAAMLALPPPAAGAREPRKHSELLAFGATRDLAGAGCAGALASFETRGPGPLLSTRLEPAVGATLAAGAGSSVARLRVLGARVEQREGIVRARWAVGPDPAACAPDGPAAAPGLSWATDELAAWTLLAHARVHAIVATPRRGVRSLGGWRVDRRARGRAPTIARAIRRFGRPSSRRRLGEGCRVRWRTLGLEITFADLARRDPCRAGLAQAGEVRGHAARQWAAVVGRRPGVTVGTDTGWLVARDVGIEHPTDTDQWQLAELAAPYALGPDPIPSVTGVLDRAGRIRGFAFWIGAAGG